MSDFHPSPLPDPTSGDDSQVGFEAPDREILPPSKTFNLIYDNLADRNEFPGINPSDTWLSNNNNTNIKTTGTLTSTSTLPPHQNMSRLISSLQNRNHFRKPPSSHFLPTLHSPQLLRRFCEAKTLLGSEECINSVIFSADDQTLVSASDDSFLYLYDLRCQLKEIQPKWRFNTSHRSNVLTVNSLDNDCKEFITTGADGQVLLHKSKSNTNPKDFTTSKLSAHEGRVFSQCSLSSHSTKDVFLTASEDGVVFRHDLRENCNNSGYRNSVINFDKRYAYERDVGGIYSIDIHEFQLAVGQSSHPAGLGMGYMQVPIYDLRFFNENQLAATQFLHFGGQRGGSDLGGDPPYFGEKRESCTGVKFNSAGDKLLASYSKGDIIEYDLTKGYDAGFEGFLNYELAHCRYSGHSNIETIKSCAYFDDDHVITGSDCGTIFMYGRNTKKAESDGVGECVFGYGTVIHYLRNAIGDEDGNGVEAEADFNPFMPVSSAYCNRLGRDFIERDDIVNHVTVSNCKTMMASCGLRNTVSLWRMDAEDKTKHWDELCDQNDDDEFMVMDCERRGGFTADGGHQVQKKMKRSNSDILGKKQRLNYYCKFTKHPIDDDFEMLIYNNSSEGKPFASAYDGNIVNIILTNHVLNNTSGDEWDSDDDDDDSEGSEDGVWRNAMINEYVYNGDGDERDIDSDDGGEELFGVRGSPASSSEDEEDDGMEEEGIDDDEIEAEARAVAAAEAERSSSSKIG